MKNVKFSPWVGTKYATKGYNGKKILVLGESHHGAYTESDLTQVVLNRFLNYKRGQGEHEDWMNTFTTFANVVIGKQVDDATMIDFWESVVFYNFVQKAVAKGSRTSPPDEDFKNSYPAFFEVLEEYKPDLVIAWGERLWKHLPDNGVRKGKFYYYPVEGKEIPACQVSHPASSTFGYEESTPYLQEAIKLA
ncbi:hypothetical protein SAMD00024442_30_28 [Candidatus Symbiothrix dinenymphae]|nr:hypothetical protein SAMD00024442_30_28 [Candidatus Symbiothrix dinenymphae]